MIDRPFCFAGLGVERDQLSGRRRFHSLHEIDVIGKVGRRHRAAHVEAQRLALLFIWRNRRQIRAANIQCGDVDQSRCGVKAHRVPVMRTQRRRVRQIELAGFFIPRGRVFDWPPRFHVIAGCPGDAVNERVC